MDTIKVDSLVIEMMIFYWESVASKDKISDEYFIEVASKPQMEVIYDEEFTKDSVRKVLSAISNRERLNNTTQKESRFWNNNMWILEDLETMHNMIYPIKTLNLDDITAMLKDTVKHTEVNIVFIPAHMEEFYVRGNTLYINFFKLIPSYEDPKEIKIAGMPLKEYITEKLKTAL